MMMFTPCLGIIFQKVADKKITGHKLFESFIQENKLCFWNVHLVEAINSTKYVGYIKPSTLFVTATDAYVQVLRDAWTRRILKSPKGFIIETIDKGVRRLVVMKLRSCANFRDAKQMCEGDVKSIEMQKIDQLKFVPLPDVICNVIVKMSQNGQPTTLDVLQDEIYKECPMTEPPSMRTIRQTIQSLLKKNILKYDLKQLHICLPPTAPYHSSKIPSKCTIQCQTGQSIMDGHVPFNSLKTRKGFLARLFMKKGSPSRIIHKIQEPEKNTPQPHAQDIVVNATKCTDKTTFTAQKKCVHCKYEFHRSRRKAVNVNLPNNLKEPICYNCMVSRHYGPIDPPGDIPYPADHVVIYDEISRKRRRRRKMDGCARTLNALQRGSNLAFLPSPVITDISNGYSGCLSGSISPDGPTILKWNHTYVNMLSGESTQFEDVMQD